MSELDPERQASQRRLRLLAGLLLVQLTLLAYLPAFQAGTIWDDDVYLTDNPLLRQPGGLARIWLEPRATRAQYYPLVFTSFWLEVRLWGLDPFGFHAVNVLLHLTSALLVWRLFARLRLGGGGWLAPWAAALLWGVHPVTVESVAWIAERKNVLSGVCALGAALAWFRVAPPDEEGPPRWRERWPDYALGTLLFVGALLSKSVTASLPAALLLARWWRVGRLRPADALPLLPWFALGLGAGLHTAWLERVHVGAEGERFALEPAARLLLAGRVPWVYLSTLLWPVGLCFFYPRWEVGPGQLPWLLATLGLLGLLIGMRRRWGRGPLVAALYFGGTLLPVLGFVNVYPFRFSWVADHFQYLASLGPLALLASGLALPGLAARPRLGPALAVGAALLLAGATHLRCRAFQDEVTLWEDTLARNPTAWLAHNNLGRLLCFSGRPREGLEHLRAALRLEPEEPLVVINVGTALSRVGEAEEAAQVLEDGVRRFPGVAGVHAALAEHRLGQGQAAEALQGYQEAARLAPDYAGAVLGEGRAQLALGQVREGLESFRRAAALAPEDPGILARTAWLLATAPLGELRHPEEAEGLARRALAITTQRRPEVLAALAAALADQGRWEEALAAVEEGLADAEALDQAEWLERLARHQAAYLARRPWRDPLR